MKDWALTNEETNALLASLRQVDEEQAPEEGWVHLEIAVPKDFSPLFEKTLRGYKLLRQTDKSFPALEAIVMEAHNALPQEILDLINIEES